MSDEQIVKPTNVHITGGETADLETKNVHITGGEGGDAIAEKIGIKNVHITGEPTTEDPITPTPTNVHITSEPAK